MITPAERLGLAALRRIDPERSHRLALTALRLGFVSGAPAPDPVLAISGPFGALQTPIGVAAGFDKNAEIPDAMLGLGFGFVEIGAVTPRPQAGNPRPRLFRLAEDRAAINRFGFNNEGLDAVEARLRRRKGGVRQVWANLGANKDSEDRVGDYLISMTRLHGLVGAMTLNISSPNTEKLRDLQGPKALEALLTRAIRERDRLATVGDRTPLLVKIAPDLEEREIFEIAEIAMDRGVDGIVATNTTLSRGGLSSPHREEAGGLSGAPLKARALAVLKTLRRATGGRVPLVGVGGIETAEDAYQRIRAGASLIQTYTAMVYQGPRLGAIMAAGLAERLRRDGFATVEEAVGADGQKRSSGRAGSA